MADVSIALLDRRLYSIGEAATLLGESPSTLSYWLRGATRNGRDYLPALREERNDDGQVTWGEFIEASLLRELRRRGVKLDTIRTFSRAVRLAFDWSYPLARHDLYTGGKALLYRAQQVADLPDEARLLVAGPTYGTGQQVLDLGETLEAFLRPVEFDDVVPVVFRPDPEAREVACDVRLRFGRPQVRGIPTDALWELHAAGERTAGIAANFGLDETEVEEAIAFEQRRYHADKAA